MSAKAERRRNRRAGVCDKCRTNVPAGAGYLYAHRVYDRSRRNHGGYDWKVRCESCQNPTPKPREKATPVWSVTQAARWTLEVEYTGPACWMRYGPAVPPAGSEFPADRGEIVRVFAAIGGERVEVAGPDCIDGRQRIVSPYNLTLRPFGGRHMTERAAERLYDRVADAIEAARTDGFRWPHRYRKA